LGGRELVAMVGGGGKTSALRVLAGELAATGSKVIVATTTAMLLRELAVWGPVVLEADESMLAAGLFKALAAREIVGAAAALGVEGKVVGLSLATVDRLWAEVTRGLADYVLVEADGSRGRPLKAFGSHEPQVPFAATLVVQVAGLDAIGMPLDEEHAHRADAIAAALRVPLGTTVTSDLFARCLREQILSLAHCWESARTVTVLNKAEGPERERFGLYVALDLLGASKRPGYDPAPEAVVVASLREGRFIRVCVGNGE
jgi:probable selenium-dependent hydroxylase accessory protein YqeC